MRLFHIHWYLSSFCFLGIFTVLALDASTFKLRYIKVGTFFAFAVWILPKGGATQRKEKKPREE
jgi:hypothetical protein